MMSLVVGLRKTRRILLEDFLVLLLGLGDPGLIWMLSSSIVNINFSPLVGVHTSSCIGPSGVEF